jgi:predicted nucleotidyltransferase
MGSLEPSIIDSQAAIAKLSEIFADATMKQRSDHNKVDIARPAKIALEVAQLARSIFGEGAEVFWFGSWPQGKARPRSDIDVAISTGEPIPLEQMGRLQDAVDELPTLYEIDILDLDATGPALREEILKHGERL